MPVEMTSTAVSEGRPPSCSAMPIATGVVTDFGASEASASLEPPSSQAMPTAEAAAVAEPAMMLASTAKADRRTLSNCRYSGMASATVAGPSRKCTNCAPSKYVS